MSLKQCCATGSLHTGTPIGRRTKVHGLDCYVADAPSGSPKGIVVIIPDAFGIELLNNQVLADAYAKEGNFQVLLPDFMAGSPVPAEALISLSAMSKTGLWNQLYKVGHAVYILRHMVPFLYFCREAVCKPRIRAFMHAVREHEAASLPVGVAGFCWGGGHVTKLCWDDEKTKDGKGLVDCGFIAHPSFLTYPGDIEKVALPLSCAAAEHDQQMSAANAKSTEEVLVAKTAKTKDQGVEHEFVMYPGAHHGFAVRADEEDKEEAARGKEAEAQAVAWFSKCIVAPPINLAYLTSCYVNTSGDWAFTDMDYHVLQLSRPDISSRMTTGASQPTPEDASLFGLRPWTHISLNEGSFLRAYGSYEFFERGPPSLTTSVARGLSGAVPSPLLPNDTYLSLPILPELRSFTYTAIFPFANHAQFTSMFKELEEITLQFAPDVSTGILSDKARVGKAELADCWQELYTAYTELVKVVRTTEIPSPYEVNETRWATAKPDLAIKKITVRDFAIKAIQEDLEEIFAPLCAPVWAQDEPGVFTRMQLDEVRLV
ncbi:hypothetical protein B0A48_04322 [Cryoendolithus antarcticus]|uniref:Dienelactone hydrolase domain-containing protein n=1 Tax=Cryoendolithus antarcticus TaxID=1507870 RepID=A0A1V8TF06_9PEZI|nr:hypothetical protein B0A48_04322 [Cryoendolithus antarcticus]